MTKQDLNSPDDAPLNAMMNMWRAPPVSSAFVAAVTRKLAEQTAGARWAPAWPLSPARLIAATALASALGCALGFILPLTETAVDSVDMIALLW